MINIKPALDYFKTQSKLADALGLSKMVVYQWTKRGVPADRIKDIAEVTDEVVLSAMVSDMLGRKVKVSTR
ncbi:MAG: Cro/CI family transcriptional regulator [Methylococcaceae bacterium]